MSGTRGVLGVNVWCLQVAGKVQAAIGEDKLDAVVCVAGGWAGGNTASPGQCVACIVLYC